MKKYTGLMVFVFLLLTHCASSQNADSTIRKVDSTKNIGHFSGGITVTNNGISPFEQGNKETTEKTTSQIIAERILWESKILLKHSAWNVSKIAYALGFTETTHFNNFFKKHVEISPLKFRNV